MAGSLNKVCILGNLGKDPEIRSMQNGNEVAKFSVATTESWKSKEGEKVDKTEWHSVVVFSQGLVNIVKNYVKKGSRVYLEGALQTRKWTDKDNIERYTTEIVLQGFNATILLLDKKEGSISIPPKNSEYGQAYDIQNPNDDLPDDEIPF